MPTLGNYYIDGTSFANAATVFTDAAMTTPAGNGYYSDGTIVRQQIGGLLQPAASCPECTQPCDTGISYNGLKGLYDIDFGLGSSTGCVIIYFNSAFGPDGIRVVRGGSTFNRLTSPIYGFLGSQTAGNYSFVGRPSQDCGIALQLAAGGYTNLNQYEWSGTNFTLIGNLGTLTGDPFDVNLTPNYPEWCTLYLPKVPSSLNDILIQIASPCPTAIFDIEINCPVVLTGVPTSNRVSSGTSSEDICNTVGTYPNTYYNVPNRGGVAGCPALHEFFVQDPYGNNKVPAGKYKIPAIPACAATTWSPQGNPAVLEVDSNGVIIDIYECPI